MNIAIGLMIVAVVLLVIYIGLCFIFYSIWYRVDHLPKMRKKRN